MEKSLRAVGQLSLRLGFGEFRRELQQVCLEFAQQRSSQACHTSMAKELRGKHLQSLGTGRWGMMQLLGNPSAYPPQ